jgi:glycosyltransferase involved in cell wall biosynthesis
MILMSHITGNPNSKDAAAAFVARGWLSELHTTLSWHQDGMADRLLPSRLTRELRRRSFPAETRPYLRRHVFPELQRLILRRLLPPALVDEEKLIRKAAALFDQKVAKAVRVGRKVRAVYGYIDSSLHTFQAAKKKGLKCIYEMPTPGWRTKERLMAEEKQRKPQWAATLTEKTSLPQVRARRDEELRLADMIIVPSEFVKRSLEELPSDVSERVRVVAYGRSVPAHESDASTRTAPAEDGLRVLFVGNLTQAKGLSYLAEALQALQSVSLTIVGRRVNGADCAALEAFLQRYRHIDGLPNSELMNLMRQHDVLVLPTLYEGMSLSVLEAMCQGLAVITTPHSGFEGVIIDGAEGFIIPIRDAAQLADRLMFLAKSPEILARMKHQAKEKSRMLSTQEYRRSLCQALEPLLAVG